VLAALAGHIKMKLSESKEDFDALVGAVNLLESPSIIIKIANLLGKVVETGESLVPKPVRKRIVELAEAGLRKSLDAAIYTMEDAPGEDASTKTHKLMTAISGAAGGAFGWISLGVEVPVTMTLMMRAIADVARSEGFSLTENRVKAACIEVFAFGGDSKDDDDAASGYYATRAALTGVMGATASELAGSLSEKSLSQKEVGKWLANLIKVVAERLGFALTEKAAAAIVPVLGAASGAAINALLTNHFQDMARGHFTVLRLEDKYGSAQVKQEYERCRQAYKHDPR